MSKRNKTLGKMNCFAAMSKDSGIVTFFKKEPKQTEDGTFYGDEIIEYPASDFPELSYENSPKQACYNNGTFTIKMK